MKLRQMFVGLGETKIRRAFPRGSARQVVKLEIRLWYFCGQTKNHRQIGGDFSEIGGPEEDRTPEPFGCEPYALARW